MIQSTCSTEAHLGRLYRNVIDISIGHVGDRWILPFAFASVAFGSLLFVWCLVAGHQAAAFTMLGTFWSIGGLCLGRYLAEEYLTEGDDLIVDVCKCDSVTCTIIVRAFGIHLLSRSGPCVRCNNCVRCSNTRDLSLELEHSHSSLQTADACSSS